MPLSMHCFKRRVAFAISFYYDRKKLIERMERMIGGIRHADLSTHFRVTHSDDELDRLMEEMNEALEMFRSRTHDSMMEEAETKAWQKLISVLTHEIMNSIAPIISLTNFILWHCFFIQSISRATDSQCRQRYGGTVAAESVEKCKGGVRRDGYTQN